MMRCVLAGIVGVGSMALATAQSPPTNLMPSFKGATGPAAIPSAPQAFEIRPLQPKVELKQQKPDPSWALKPEHGEWLIEVKSYAQMESGIMAQALATEIRDKYKAPVYLYEWGAEARKKKEDEEAVVRKRIEEEMRPFFEYQQKLKAEAESRGEVFDETPIRVKVPVYYREVADQYLVVVGGYKDMETAKKALEIIRKWPQPSDVRLLDQMERAVIKNGQKVFETNYVNPYADARVVRNLTWPKLKANGRDEFLIKLNENEEMSCCRSKHKYTMVVKAFNCPVSKMGSDEDAKGNAGRGPRAGVTRPGQWLDATAQQAREMASKLREMADASGKKAGFDAFVLHHRTGSFVTIGQYDSPDEAKLKNDYDRIWRMSYVKNEQSKDKSGQAALGQMINDKQGLFDSPYMIEIPK